MMRIPLGVTAGGRNKAGVFAVLGSVAVALSLALFTPAPGMMGRAQASSPPRVALTFDDGYNFDHRILDYLASQGIAASAFVIGSWAQRNPSLLHEMNDLGWEICNHTQNHPALTKIPDQQIHAELNACQTVISSITGQYQPFFRPPGGYIDARVRGILASMGYIPVMWDFDSMDSRGPFVPSVQSRVDGMVNSAGDGDVILFHFGGLNTYQLLCGVVDGLKKKGFCFVTLGELFGIKDEIRGGECGPGQAESADRFYFAEGNTRPGFEEWLLVLNPGREEADLRVEYVSPQGKLRKTYTVPARERLSIKVNSEVPWSDDVSMVLESTSPLAAERMLYFNRGNGFSGASLSPGAGRPSTCHYFAEGSVRPGFEEWLALFNPSGVEEARVELKLLGEGGKVAEAAIDVLPLARVTVKVNDLVEWNGDLSMILQSSKEVVAERSQYFVYNNLITGSHSAPGCCEPGNEWYLAEGTTRDFFDSYLVILNPCRYPTLLKIELLASDGGTREEVVELAADERKTLHINEYLPPDLDYSVHLSSLLPVVVERSSYFRSHNTTGGYCQTGELSPSDYWLFPEGCTASGFQEWLALLNPTLNTQEVTVEYLCGEGETQRRNYSLPPLERITIDVVAEAGRDDYVSIEVKAPGGVVAERSIYFSRPATGL
jgi:peptidoglycan/xylan/chitin deacetylase (PgdA/CDA1 family)